MSDLKPERAELATQALLGAYERLLALNPRWVVEVGPGESAGWIVGSDFTRPDSGAFKELLQGISERMQTPDRKVAAASFALRFGWSSAVAFGPYLERGVVPDVQLANVSLRSRPGRRRMNDTISKLERTAQCTRMRRRKPGMTDECMHG